MDKKNNSGDWNLGNYNSGDENSGNYNSGNWNSGCYNSDNRNSGDYNSGNRNSGDYNSGSCNSGDWNSGFFNTNEPTIRMFNKDTGLKRSDINLPYIELKITELIEDKLITRTYKEAWKLYWNEASEEDKQMFLDLPNFDTTIFEEITGINVINKEISSIDFSKLSKESLIEIIKQLRGDE